MAGTYTYSLIRAVPDPRRGEWVNIGVVVYLADRLDVHLLGNLSKLRVLAPTLDTSFLDTLPSDWERLCRGLTDIETRHAMLSHFPVVHASPLAQFMADDKQYQKQVDGIMRDLVKPAPLRQVVARPTRLVTALRGHFTASKIMGNAPRDIDRHLVVSQFPVEAGAGLYADFAMRNGVMRITETIDFRVTPENIRSGKRGQAALKAVTLNRAIEKFGKDCIPTVVYAADANTMELVQPSLNMLSDFSARLYDANNPQDLADYMRMMHEAATV